MKTRTLLIGSALVAGVGLLMAPGLAIAQGGPSPDGVELKRVEPLKAVHSKGGSEDFAKARADADAKAKARQDVDVDQKNKQHTDVDVKNKLTQNQDVKNKITNNNTNQLTTGDTINYNSNVNKQTQQFGIPILGPVRERKAP
jgi:hypothetical protein